MPHIKELPRVMLLVETTRSYGRSLLEGIGRYVAMHGPWSIDFEERGLHEPLPGSLEQWQGDGIISRTLRRADVDRLVGLQVPVIELYADPELGLPRVFTDRTQIAGLAVGHFRDRGLRQLAFFAIDHAGWVERRLDAFRSEATKHELSCHVFEPKGKNPGGNRAMERRIAQWVHALPKPCGVYCPFDGFALRLMNVCREIGVAIPEQIAVLGSDNDTVICSMTQPPLSSISLGTERIGYEAAALLDRMMAGGKPPKGGVSVEPEGVVTRQSTDILALSDADVARAVRTIRERACRGLRVDDVAEAIAISRRSLEQRFRRALGRTPKEEITRVRLERAQRLLRQTTMSIQRIAAESGFRSIDYFDRVFRRQTGLTPRAYRQSRQNPYAGDSAL